LKNRGVTFVGPVDGDMACGEFGMGRMSEPAEIVESLVNFFDGHIGDRGSKPLAGRHAIVTSGPTHEPIDPVRYIANRSSGKQGHAIAAALAAYGCKTTLVSGPTSLPDPVGCDVIKIESAREMLAAVESALPADIAICAAAVADWRTDNAPDQKIKKQAGADTPTLSMVENPDILATLSKAGNKRPPLVVGFAAETNDVIANATDKRARKGCDWMVANDVSPATGTFSGDSNTVHFIDEAGTEDWPKLSKSDVAARLVDRIARHFEAAE
jgi:phosphopantothenoylcysteine decarboxylase/phosphopantothenate--cysteine ligase